MNISESPKEGIDLKTALYMDDGVDTSKLLPEEEAEEKFFKTLHTEAEKTLPVVGDFYQLDDCSFVSKYDTNRMMLLAKVLGIKIPESIVTKSHYSIETGKWGKQLFGSKYEVVYWFNDNMKQDYRKQVRSAMREWEKGTNLKFKEEPGNGITFRYEISCKIPDNTPLRKLIEQYQQNLAEIKKKLKESTDDEEKEKLKEQEARLEQFGFLDAVNGLRYRAFCLIPFNSISPPDISGVIGAGYGLMYIPEGTFLQTDFVGKARARRDLIHELGHMIGLPHEQQRHDARDYVEDSYSYEGQREYNINHKKLRERSYRTRKHKILWWTWIEKIWFGEDVTHGLPFDYNSIMMYPGYKVKKDYDYYNVPKNIPDSIKNDLRYKVTGREWQDLRARKIKHGETIFTQQKTDGYEFVSPYDKDGFTPFLFFGKVHFNTLKQLGYKVITNTGKTFYPYNITDTDRDTVNKMYP